MSKKLTDSEMAVIIAQKVAEHDGRTFYVGGYVRDQELGFDNKDIDIEIHGIEVNVLRNILMELGHIDERKVGENFGVFALKGYDLDIALPRREKGAEGGGHKDFIIDVDPFIGYENAARRRDFTINALYKDVLTGEILDYFGGLNDLEHGIIRHINDETFVEDPLRVLRAAQFAARFDFEISYDTFKLASCMDITKLSHERVAEELKKALLKAKRPSVFFELLAGMNQLDYWFPEIKALIDTPQEPTHHPEGDVFNHTMLVINEAAKVRHKVENPLFFMVAALCHDFGKPEVTTFNKEKIKIQAIGHDEAGVPYAKAFVKRIFNNNDMKAYISILVKNHMKPFMLINNENTKEKKFMQLFDETKYNADLIWLARCDKSGRAVEFTTKDNEKLDKLFLKIADYEELMTRPQVTGRDLIKLGVKPAESYGNILSFTHKLHLAGVPKDIALKQAAGEFGFKKLLEDAEMLDF